MEILSKVASTYKVSIDEIIEENKLDESDIFMPGQKIFFYQVLLFLILHLSGIRP